jgi:hypothetical protein
MSQKPDEQQPQSLAITAPPLRIATPASPDAPPAPSATPVQTDTDRGEMWIQF